MDLHPGHPLADRPLRGLHLLIPRKIVYAMMEMMALYPVKIRCSSSLRGAQPHCAFCGWSAVGQRARQPSSIHKCAYAAYV
eukprot:5221452-Pyramimonas_sp.AAC.1